MENNKNSDYIKTDIYKVLSVLLMYPDKWLISSLKEVDLFIRNDLIISNLNKDRLIKVVDHFKVTDLMNLQEQYVNLFDRQKGLSLYLFEHIHGDSRLRGQAMVDLRNMYEEYGFISTKDELPDFIPLFLEYLSFFEDKKAADFLSEVVNIIAILELRLKFKGSLYYFIFNVLKSLSSFKPDEKFIRKALNMVSE